MRELFDLKPTEQIYDDFACKEGLMNSGRMYLTENYLCFFRNLIGFQKKIKILWTDIQQIEGKSNTIKVHSNKEKDSPFSFGSFSNFETSFKYIQKLWNSACGVDSEAVDSEAEE